MNVNSQPLGTMMDTIAPRETAPAQVMRERLGVRVTHRIEEVEAIWRAMSADRVESPGQSYDFIRLWVRNRGLEEANQLYVVGEVDGQAVAILPLHRKRAFGVWAYTWFPGTNAGCYAPIVDNERLVRLGAEGRAALWREMTGKLSGAALIYLRCIPTEVAGVSDLFAELGTTLPTETLYRAQFGSWENCDAEQRSRSRRKHDRQQGDRLAALGTVEFEEITDPACGHAAIDIMFHQRSERFRSQGIRDCFVEDDLVGFYREAMEPASGMDVRLHVLRLDGKIVAVRYNIVHGDRMFCLISSMSDCSTIQSGSPGKQCLLRVMQTVFGQGIRTFDMGNGFTDEKRHWCNVQTQLHHHYVGLSPAGSVVISVHRNFQRFRAWAKSNPTLKKCVRAFTQLTERSRKKPVSDQL